MLFICAFWSVEVGYDILRLLSIHEHDHLAILSLDSFLNISELFTCKPSWQRSWYTFTLKKSLFLCGSNPVPTEVYGIKLSNVSRINHKPRETSFRVWRNWWQVFTGKPKQMHKRGELANHCYIPQWLCIFQFSHIVLTVLDEWSGNRSLVKGGQPERQK